MKLVWIIAGSDPSGAAGCQLDQRVLNDYGIHSCTVITAATAQNFSQWFSSNKLDATVIATQFESLSSNLMHAPAAVKIGMLGSVEAVAITAKHLEQLTCFKVLDPMLRSSSGGRLCDDDTASAIRSSLINHVNLITPNAEEAEFLSGLPIKSPADMQAAGEAILNSGARAVLIKGGHLEGYYSSDYFADASGGYWLTTPRLAHSARGTGCALSSVIAANMALGLQLPDSIVSARAYLNNSIRNATSTNLGGVYVMATRLAPFHSEDLPTLTKSLPTENESPQFPNCGPEPLGFYPIVDRFNWVKKLVDWGTTTIQLRIKDLQGSSLIREAEQSVAYCKRFGVRLFINDYWQLAIELRAFGVHLGQEDLETANLNSIAAAGLRLGISTHCYSEAAIAKAIRPSYVALGPIFPTTCKSLRFGPHGMQRIDEWSRLFSQPLVAIGGLKAEQAAEAMSRGASGVAVISDVTKSSDPEKRVKQWLQACRQI